MHIKVRVITGAPKEVIQKIEDDHIEMYLRQPPERGLANKRILEIMTAMYPDRAIKIVNGHHSPSKLIEVSDKNN
ncbi:MAG TPA: DUF167 domain-containing protein [Candidatus Paceibacterota bacterium]|jgi:uncharacterized protein (TIGR00251 family)|nr:DUF167 domain-containing protein [Candidatus Paceibacterota bacterium]